MQNNHDNRYSDEFHNKTTEKIRLNKYLSEAGVCSRRKADEWIMSGKVSVNGEIAGIGMKVQDTDTIIVAGKKVMRKQECIVIAFYKPKGISCTAHRGDNSGLFQNYDFDKNLKYIGRLDKDSEGLLLLTNDGDLCNAIAKSANQHEKEYIVKVDKVITEAFIRGMASGVPIMLPGQEEPITTKQCKVKKQSADTFSIILTQGLNRQIRRMCEYFGYRAWDLKRIRVMNIELGNMKRGEHRNVAGEERSRLIKMAMEGK